MRALLMSLACAGLVLSLPASAELKIGDKAPDFTLEAAVGGKAFQFSLAESLRHGPVVIYFYPKSFTQGCTVEAHDFADAAAEFTAAGASLIGISADGIETQKEFSSKECRDKFPVGADPDLTVIRAYDAVFLRLPGIAGVSDRTSYVVDSAGIIRAVYSDQAPDKHVETMLKVVRALQAPQN
jgi:peroxiredoxin